MASHRDNVTLDSSDVCKSTNLTNPTMHLSHNPQCNIQNKSAHFCSEWCIVRYMTGALWDLWIYVIAPKCSSGCLITFCVISWMMQPTANKETVGFPSSTSLDDYWQDAMALSYYSDLTLSQSFQPMGAQLSKKAALPLAQIIATASCRSSKTGPCNAHGTLTQTITWTNAYPWRTCVTERHDG